MPLIICFGILLTLIFGLPLLGFVLAGHSFPAHLTIFPIPTEPGEASVSWLVCGMLAILLVVTLTPFLRRLFQIPSTKHESPQSVPFPWWGWIALLWVLGSWTLAWNRFSWFQPWQPHTFPLLWFGYIACINAFTYHRSGYCLLRDRPRFFWRLFFLSAGFWWCFEYLNQFVNNWHYVHLPETSPFHHVFHTSIAFATVLPAVLSTYEWLGTIPRLTKPFENWQPLPWATSHTTGWAFLSLGGLGLGLIGIWPTILFSLLWLSPFSLLLGIQIIRNDRTCVHGLIQGDWRPVILSALAALVCGFWWELWNAYSLVHWEYTIPYVSAFKVFEMPVLGYSGYLPFGVTCLAITTWALGYQPNDQLNLK
jgi:hypothetical protein